MQCSRLGVQAITLRICCAPNIAKPPPLPPPPYLSAGIHDSVMSCKAYLTKALHSSKGSCNILLQRRVCASTYMHTTPGGASHLMCHAAGVPGMVGGMLRHMKSLRSMRRDNGWIHTLLEEAENERMHLLTFLKLREPGFLFRGMVLLSQVC